MPAPDASSNASPARRRAGVLAVCLAGIAFNTFLFGPSLRLTYKGWNDFRGIYTGTQLAFTDKMYDLRADLAVQPEPGTLGWAANVNRVFLRLPFDAVLMWPLGRLPFAIAAHVWEALVVAAIVGFCVLWPGSRETAAMACSWSYPVYHVFANGQDVALLLLVVVIVLRALRSRRDTEAGALFSLCAIKYHLFLLAPLALLRNRLWRFAAGVAAGGAVLVVLSFIAGGWNWPARYLKLVRNPFINPKANEMPTIYGMTAGLPNSGLLEALGILAVVALAWLAIRRGGVEYGFAAVLAGGILTAPHAYASDCAMMVPALLITLPLAAREWQRNLHMFLFSPLATIWLLIGPAWITGLALIVYMTAIAFGPMVERRKQLATA